MEQTVKKYPWDYRSWFIIPTFVTFYLTPVGLIMMLLGKRYPLWLRITASAFLGPLWLIGMVGLIGKNQPNTNSKTVQATQQVQVIETPKPLTHEENIKKLAECNAQYIDAKVKAKLKRITKDNPLGFENIDPCAFRMVHFGKMPVDDKCPEEEMAAYQKKQKTDEDARIKEAQELASPCQQIYSQIYDQDRANLYEATKDADLKFPDMNSSRQNSDYGNKLNTQLKLKLLQEYQISEDQLGEIESMLSPVKEKEQQTEAQKLQQIVKNLIHFPEQKLRQIIVMPDPNTGKGYIVSIEYNADGNRHGLLNDSIEYLHKLYQSNDLREVNQIWLRLFDESIDLYGKESTSLIGKIIMDRQLAQKINWDRMDRETFEALMTVKTKEGETDNNENGFGVLWLLPKD